MEITLLFMRKSLYKPHSSCEYTQVSFTRK